MGFLYSLGLFILGIAIIAGVFIVSGRGNKQRVEKVDCKEALPPVEFDSPHFIAELEKQVQQGNSRFVDQVVDELERGCISELVRERLLASGAADRYKAGLADLNYKTRTASAERLGKIGGPDVAELLFEAMGDKNEAVTLAATEALKKINEPGIAATLIQALKEPYKWLPARLAEVLVSLGAAAVPALQDALGEDDPALRGYVIEILAEIGDKSSAQALCPALKDDNGNIRLQAARAIGAIASRESVPHLAALLKDPELKVQVQAVKSLGQIGGEEAAQAAAAFLDGENQVLRNLALEALSQMGAEGMNIIRQTAGQADHPAAARAGEIVRQSPAAAPGINISFE